MAFQVPEHVMPIRAAVQEFIESKVYPVEEILEERGTAESKKVMAELMSEAKAAGLWALGHPKENRRSGHALPRLRVCQRGDWPIDTVDGPHWAPTRCRTRSC